MFSDSEYGIYIGLLTIIILVALNAFFVASEFAIVKIRLSQLELEIKNGKRWAKIAKSILLQLDRYLSGIQLGITVASLLLGWVGEPAIAHWIENILRLSNIILAPTLIHTIAFIIALFGITFLHIVFGEQIPKLVAIKTPITVTAWIAFPLTIFQKIFFPLIWLFDRITKLCMKILGFQGAGHSDIHTEEEIKLLLTESEAGGEIAESSNELIQNVFEFDDRTVRQIYIPRSRLFAINIEEGVEQHLDTIIKEGYSRIPVYRDSLDNIIGIIFIKDILLPLRVGEPIDIKKILRPAYFVPHTQKIEQLLKDFQRLHIQLAIVTNEHGETAGVVTLEDIIEELIGEIHDEYDVEEAIVTERRPGTYIVRAESTIADANDHLPSPIPEDPTYDTVSGFINTIFGKIPRPGEAIIYGEYRITVLKSRQNTTELIKMQVQK